MPDWKPGDLVWTKYGRGRQPGLVHGRDRVGVGYWVIRFSANKRRWNRRATWLRSAEILSRYTGPPLETGTKVSLRGGEA